MNSSYYKHCIVPGCKSTSIKTPNKLFIHVPYGQKVRKQWLKLVRKDDAHCLSTKSRMYFCEDHFDLPNDMENYMQYHLMGSVAQVRMKPGCLPSKFDCQTDIKRQGSEQNSAKKSKKKRVGERQDEIIEIEIDNEDVSSASSDAIQSKKLNKPLHIPFEMMPNDKACQNQRYIKLIKNTTFTCNRYIYGDRCEAEIQVEIAPKKIPKRTTNVIKESPKIECEDKATETEDKYFVISTTKYKTLVQNEDLTELSRIESEQETENDDLGENSRNDSELENESEEYTEITSIKIEMETENEEFNEISRINSESEAGNEGFSNTSNIKSEPNIDSEELTKTTLQSGTDINNEIFIEISSIKSEPMDEIS